MRRVTWMFAAMAVALTTPAAAQDAPKAKGKAVEAKAKRGMADLEREAKAMKGAAEQKGGNKADKMRRAADKGPGGKTMDKPAERRGKSAAKKAEAMEKKAGKKAEVMEKKARAKAKGADKAASRGTAKEQRARARDRMQKAGVDISKPAVIQQQRRHAMRLAKLARIRELAEAKGKTKVVARVDRLMVKETTRHAGWLDERAKKGAEEGKQ